jgi:exodeoxyribonuclease (lambda-induced)
MKIHDVGQRTEEWFKLRAGIPTASEAGKLVTSTGKKSSQITDYSYQLAAELYAGKPLDRWEGNQWTDRGGDLELIALTEYSRIKDATIDVVGFCTVDDGTYGCSPDGLLADGIAEIKCLAAKNHIKNMVYYDKYKAAMPDYIPQTQMQMLVCEREWCDMMFYHPDLPPLIIRQFKIKEVQEILMVQLKACIEKRDQVLKIIKGESEQDNQISQ